MNNGKQSAGFNIGGVVYSFDELLQEFINIVGKDKYRNFYYMPTKDEFVAYDFAYELLTSAEKEVGGVVMSRQELIMKIYPNFSDKQKIKIMSEILGK